ncbi:MAG: prephenate dehydrogenase/arogenate dehydrogenase family protein [Halobacteriaceae archaeon]
MTLLVVGAGDVGRWFAEVVGGPVAFADADPAVAEAAAATVAPDARAVPLDADETFDVVCVAVPLPLAAEAVERHAPKAGEAVVDVTGAMGPPLDAMARAAPDRERASFHPLFAPDAAPGNVAVTVDADGPTVEALRGAVADAGNDLVSVTAVEHDDAMETVQGRTHAAVIAFALAADDDVPDGLETPVYETLRSLAERVTGGTPRVYADIQSTFDGADSVAAAARRIADADREEFETLYEDAR